MIFGIVDSDFDIGWICGSWMRMEKVKKNTYSDLNGGAFNGDLLSHTIHGTNGIFTYIGLIFIR